MTTKPECLQPTQPCFGCRPIGIERKVIKEGPTIYDADPIKTYELECGHFTF